MRTSDKVIVTFADEAGNYRKAVDRMKQSLITTRWDGDFLPFHDYDEIGSPPHKGKDAVPYAFKAHAMRLAIEMGYTELLWLDSVVFATAPIDPVFRHIKRYGYLFFENIGYSVGDFTSDACLKKWGWQREWSFNRAMTMACCYGISMDNPDIKKLMDMYIKAASDGISYQGEWHNNTNQASQDDRVRGHRHDQSVQSILCHEFGLTLTKGQETFFAYKEHATRMPIASSVCLWSEGI